MAGGYVGQFVFAGRVLLLGGEEVSDEGGSLNAAVVARCASDHCLFVLAVTCSVSWGVCVFVCVLAAVRWVVTWWGGDLVACVRPP